MKKVLVSVLALIAIAAIGASVPASAAAADSPAAVAGKGKKKNKKTFTVCKHGCKYKTISKAVKKVKKKNSTIKVKPGKYVEGVIVEGHKYDGLTIKGTKDNARKVILEGKNAKSPDGLAQNAIEGIDVDDITMENMWARNYASNGFFVRDSDAGPEGSIDCNDYVMKNLVVSHNRGYGLFAFGCAGGKMVDSEGWGHGDSAFYVGGTPFQDDPKQTLLKNLDSYENVLGYSGTNSKYVMIKDSDFYNNGIGLVPNTLDSEPFEPAADSVIKDNNIFWNNFNYYLPNSGVQTVSNGLGQIGDLTLNYPTGIGIALFGSDGWTIKNNEIFGHFKWGSALFSDPFNEGDDAISRNNQFIDNTNGRGGQDTNAVDFWNDGSGGGNCFEGNVSSTFSPDPSAVDPAPNSYLYPACPPPPPGPVGPDTAGTGTSAGVGGMVGELIVYVTADPPENMQCSWTEHPHPPFEDFEPVNVTPGPSCP